MEYNIIKAKGHPVGVKIHLADDVFTFFDYGGFPIRNPSTIKLIIDGLKSNEEFFYNKKLEILINASDRIINDIIGYAHPTDKYKTIPCFSFDGWNKIGIDGFENAINEIKIQANTTPTINKLFWSGTIFDGVLPRILYRAIATKYPNLVICNSIKFLKSIDSYGFITAANNFVTLPEHCKYKYLIDIEGIGWSARLKFLCFTKRVLFINERPYQEFWMDGLVDGENCIMVKRDLSNLIEKLEYVESNPELYNKLSNNLYEFAEKTFTKENINNHIVEVFKKNIFYSNSQSEIKSLI
jgi:glycosyltransferase involved in cell wall biosynthesis